MAIVLWKLLRVKGVTTIMLEQENRNQNYSGQIEYTLILVNGKVYVIIIILILICHYIVLKLFVTHTNIHVNFDDYHANILLINNLLLFINPRKWAYCICKPWETSTSQPFQRDRKFLLIHYPPGVRPAQNYFLKNCSLIRFSLQDRPWLLPTIHLHPIKAHPIRKQAWVVSWDSKTLKIHFRSLRVEMVTQFDAERSSCLDTDLFFEISRAAYLYKDWISCVTIEPWAEGHEGVNIRWPLLDLQAVEAWDVVASIMQLFWDCGHAYVQPGRPPGLWRAKATLEALFVRQDKSKA